MVMNKKGAEGMLWIIVIAVIMIVFAIGAVYFIYEGQEKFVEVFDQLPGPLAAKLEICKTSINEQIFCEFTSIENDVGTLYVNCEYPGSAFKQGIANSGIDMSCPGAEEEKCAQLLQTDGFEGATINGGYCDPVKGFIDKTSGDEIPEDKENNGDVEEEFRVAEGGECDEDEEIFCEDGLVCSTSGICQPSE